MLEELRIRFVGIDFSTRKRKIEELADVMRVKSFLKRLVAVRKDSHAIASLFQLNERSAHIVRGDALRLVLRTHVHGYLRRGRDCPFGRGTQRDQAATAIFNPKIF